jgi:hypothetical protein
VPEEGLGVDRQSLRQPQQAVSKGFRWQTAQLQEEAVWQVPERLRWQATQLQEEAA